LFDRRTHGPENFSSVKQREFCDAPQRRVCRGIATDAWRAEPPCEMSGRKMKIGSPTELRACRIGRNVSVGLRDVIDARLAVVDDKGVPFTAILAAERLKAMLSKAGEVRLIDHNQPALYGQSRRCCWSTI
jgi:hypothetical protein